MVPWLGSANCREREAADLLLGLGSRIDEASWIPLLGDPADSDLARLALAVSPHPAGEASLGALLDGANESPDARDRALAALGWGALWDPRAFAACLRLNPHDCGPEGPGLLIDRVTLEDGVITHWVPPGRRLDASLLEGPEPPQQAPVGVPGHLTVLARAALALSRSEDDLGAHALGLLLMLAWGDWLEAPMAGARRSGHGPCQAIGLLHLNRERRYDELAAAIPAAQPSSLVALPRISWYGYESDPAWRGILARLAAHPDPAVRASIQAGRKPPPSAPEAPAAKPQASPDLPAMKAQAASPDGPCA